MKRLGYLKLWGVVALVLPLLTVACSDDDPAEPARVEIDAAGSTVTFTYNDLEPREVSFSTNRAWTVEVPAGSWVSVSPLEGEAVQRPITLSYLPPVAVALPPGVLEEYRDEASPSGIVMPGEESRGGRAAAPFQELSL